ncbi:MAG: AAA domain-containing protein [Adhaeribacter sp.]
MNTIPVMLTSDSASYYFDRIAAIDAAEGQLPREKLIELRGVADAMCRELTRDEKLYFKDTHARLSFVFDKYQVTGELQEELTGFRRRTHALVQAAGQQVAEEEVLTGIKALALAVQHFSRQAVPEPVFARFGHRPELTFRRLSRKNHEHIPFLAVTVAAVRPATAEKPFTRLSCDSDEAGFLTLHLWDNDHFGEDRLHFATLGSRLWKYARLHLFHIQKLEGKDDVYGTTPGSMIVVEPDYLVDATKLAECMQMQKTNARIYLLNKFKPAEVNEAMLFGHLANGVLDALVSRPDTSMGEIFQSLMPEHAFSMVCLTDQGETCDVGALKEMSFKARAHGHTIREVIRKYQGQKCLLEPAFFSARYGLQGRLDLLAEDEQDPLRKNVLELKSGKVPELGFGGLWANNAAQVECYNLLLESTFPGRTGESAILYSRALVQEQPLRNHSTTASLRQTMMMVRNQIVINEHRLASDDYSLYEELSPACFGPIARFDVPVLQQFCDCLQQAPELEQAYFRAFAAFIAREQRTAKTGSDEQEGIAGFAALWQLTKAEKRAAFAILDYLDFQTLSPEREVTLARNVLSSGTMSNFRPGDIAILYPVFREDDEQAALKTQILKCNIRSVSDREVVVALRSKHIAEAHFRNNCQHWVIEHDLMEQSFDHMFKGLYAFLRAPREKRGLLLGLHRPRFQALPYAVSGEKTRELTGLQRQLLVQALSAQDYFLLQGPPGTGKTSGMLRSMAENLYHHTRESFAILAFTNRAVDEICEHLHKAGLPYLRLSKRESEDPSTLSYLSRHLKVQEIHGKIKQTRIFVSTQTSFCGYTGLLKIKKLSTVIIDEASQLLEPHLVGILPQFGRFILIGDDKQLPAVVTQPAKFTEVSDQRLQKINLRSLKDSLFYRLVTCCEKNNWPEAVGMLTQQGRMHEHIGSYVSQAYYAGKLSAIRPDQWEEEQAFSKEAADKYERALAAARMIFIPARRERKAKISLDEARHVAEVIKVVHRRYGAAFSAATLGVVTPYRAQIANILGSGYLPDPDLLELVTLDTVERFQGSERDVIVLSMAVNHPNQLQFLQSFTADGQVDRKLNVALTRARKHLVLTGCEDVLRRSPGYARLLDHIQATGGYIDWL